jgi:anti-sigma B factor antagonist
MTMNVKVARHGTVTVLKLQGNLMGGPDATAVNTQLHELLEAGTKNIVVDLFAVDFMNSSGLGILIGGISAVKNAEGALKIAHASAKIQSIIKIAKLTGVLELYDTTEAAIASFKI